jgi:hypothetical protein
MTFHQPTDLLGQIYARWATEMANHPEMSIELLRIVFDDWQRATAEPEGRLLSAHRGRRHLCHSNAKRSATGLVCPASRRVCSRFVGESPQIGGAHRGPLWRDGVCG